MGSRAHSRSRHVFPVTNACRPELVEGRFFSLGLSGGQGFDTLGPADKGLPERGEMATVLATRRLTAHPDSPVPPIQIDVKATLDGSDILRLDYDIVGAIADLLLPPPAIPERKGELWRHTCFEAFVALGDGAGYVEFNFAPSRHFAAYRFEGYRQGMHSALDLPAPDIQTEMEGNARFLLTAWIDLRPLNTAGATALGLSAVIEARDRSLSYWALAHPPGKPDFHNSDCFTVRLAAPTVA
jgi:hypothetical protein